MYNVVGIQKIDYTSKKTGDKVVGSRLHCMTETENESVSGYMVESFYCSDKVDISAVTVGSDIEIYFNKYGTVTAVKVL